MKGSCIDSLGKWVASPCSQISTNLEFLPFSSNYILFLTKAGTNG